MPAGARVVNSTSVISPNALANPSIGCMACPPGAYR